MEDSLLITASLSTFVTNCCFQAALTWDERVATYFFKGDQYWRFTNQVDCNALTKLYRYRLPLDSTTIL